MNKARLAGIFDIICGGFGILRCLFTLFAIFAIRTVMNQSYYGGGGRLTPEAIAAIAGFFFVISIFFVVLAVLAIVGSVFSFKRKHWGWALTGAISSSLTFFPLGIVSVIMVSLGRSEFLPPKPPLPVSDNPAEPPKS